MRKRRRISSLASFLALGALAIGAAASAQVFEGGIAGYCRYIPPPGNDQPFTLTTPVPAGRTVHVDVVTSSGVTLVGVDDVGHDDYAIVGGGTDGAFAASLLVGVVGSALPTGDSITVHLAASGGGGTSCASAFVADGVVATPDQIGFATGSSGSASVATGPLAAPHELVHAVLFGHPTSVNDPIATRVAPLTDAGHNVCVGTSSGRLCSFGSYALLDAADPFTATVDLDHAMAWGSAVATFEAGAPVPPGPVVGWGYNPYGQVTPPDAVNGTAGTARAIAASPDHSCAIQAGTGAVVCWGNGASGQSTPPSSVNGTAGTARAIAASSSALGSYSCAIQAVTGAVVCWGPGDSGSSTPPSSVNGTAGTASAISAGAQHACAIQAGTGAVVCWGDNSLGEAAPPDSVNGIAGTARAISAGNDYSCAIEAASGAVVCWGDNSVGEATPPDAVNGVAGTAQAISAGESLQTCAIQAMTGHAVCWGWNGNGEGLAPDAVNGAAGTASAISAGNLHSCAIRAENGAAVCWGAEVSAPPDAVNGTAGTASAIAAGTRDALAIVAPAPEPGALALGAASLAALAGQASARRARKHS